MVILRKERKMVEQKFEFKLSNSKVIERVISDDNADINHMILRKTEALPEHYSNSNVYMIVVRGTVSLCLDDQEEHRYPKGSIVTVPFKTKMNVFNALDEVLEIFVVKAPGPRTMPQ